MLRGKKGASVNVQEHFTSFSFILNISFHLFGGEVGVCVAMFAVKDKLESKTLKKILEFFKVFQRENLQVSMFLNEKVFTIRSFHTRKLSNFDVFQLESLQILYSF